VNPPPQQPPQQPPDDGMDAPIESGD